MLLYCLGLALQCAALVRRRLAGSPAGAFRIPGGAAGLTLLLLVTVVVGLLAMVAGVTLGRAA